MAGRVTSDMDVGRTDVGRYDDSAMTTQKETGGQYVYVTPVAGVELAVSVKGEYRIDRVVLLTTKRFLATRRFAFVYKKWRESASKSDVCRNQSVVATVLVHGHPDMIRRQGHNVIKDELNILSCARLGFHNRKYKGVVGIAGCMDSYDTEELLLGRNVDTMQTSSRIHTTERLRINSEFKDVAEKFMHYRRLLDIIRGKGTMDENWRMVIRNAAILAGRSQNSVELADAFLWNMIALEQLLLSADEHRKHLDLLKERCAALFGHSGLWTSRNIDKWIDQIYSTRCRVVHDGNRRCVTLEHLLLSDVILANVLRNIAVNSRFFPSKQALKQFTDKTNARVTLGFEPRPSNWKWTFGTLNYTQKDLAEYWPL